MHLVGHFLAHLTVGIDFTGLRQRKLQVLILQFIISHNRTVSPYLEITFLRVDNHVIVLIRAKHLGDHVTERIFQNANHRIFIDILQLLELRKGVNHTDCFLFLGHNLSLLESY